MKKVLNFAVVGVIAAAFIAAIVAAASVWVFFLWNWVGVGVFGAPHISFLQAGGLLLVLITARNAARTNLNFKVTK